MGAMLNFLPEPLRESSYPSERSAYLGPTLDLCKFPFPFKSFRSCPLLIPYGRALSTLPSAVMLLSLLPSFRFPVLHRH